MSGLKNTGAIIALGRMEEKKTEEGALGEGREPTSVPEGLVRQGKKNE